MLLSANESEPILLFSVSGRKYCQFVGDGRKAEHIHSLAAAKILQEDLAAIGEAYCIAMGKCLSAQLDERHFLDLGQPQALLQLFWNVTQQQPSSRWDTEDRKSVV